MLLDDCLMKCLRLYCIDLYAAISDVIRLLPYESNSESNSQVRKLGNNPVVEQGSVLPTDQGSNPGIYTKKTPSPAPCPKHSWARPWSLVPPCARIAHSHGIRHRVWMGRWVFLGLCEKGLLSFMKMLWGRSFPPQVEFFFLKVILKFNFP